MVVAAALLLALAACRDAVGPDRPITVRGVVTVDGEPWSGMRVFAVRVSDEYVSGEVNAISGADGGYELELPGCRGWTVYADPSGSPITSHSWVTTPDSPWSAESYGDLCDQGGPSSFDFAVLTAPVEFVVTASAWGKPVAGAVVTVEGENDQPVASDTVGASGIVQVDSLAWGSYRVSLSGYSGVSFDSTSVVRILYPGPDTVEFLGRPDPLPRWSAATAGGSISCGIVEGGDAYCWSGWWSWTTGNVPGGQKSRSSVPTWVPGAIPVVSIDAGGSVTCAARDDGAATCMANNIHTSPPYYDAIVDDRTDWARIGAGWDSACGVVDGGDAYCWGTLGRTANGRDVVRAHQAMVGGDKRWTFAGAGTLGGCGVTDGGEAWCWGGQASATGLTYDSVLAELVDPSPVGGMHEWAGLSVGGDHTCGVTTAGDAYCWGSQYSGQLGDGALGDSVAVSPDAPVPVAGGLTWTSLSAGGRPSDDPTRASGHSCGVTVTGDGYCWGVGTDGELGDGTTSSSAVPVPVAGGLTWASIDAGVTHTCGVTTDGVAYCWGSNGGVLGDGGEEGSAVPVRVDGGS